MITLRCCFLTCLLSSIHAEGGHAQWIQTSLAQKPSSLYRITDFGSLPSSPLSLRHGLNHTTFIGYIEARQPVFVTQQVYYTRSRSFGDSLTPRIIWKPFDTGTIAIQTLTWVGGLGVAIPVGILALFGGAGPVTIVLWGFAPPVGVYLGGKWMGGNGTFSMTFLGSIPGSLLLILARDEALFYAAIPLSLLGTLLGYHLSASSVYEAQGERYSTPQPALDPSNALHARLRLISVSIEF